MNKTFSASLPTTAGLNRRAFLRSGALAAAGSCLVGSTPMARAASIPEEPLNIGREPQFFVDDYVVDNLWQLKKGRGDQIIRRVFHAPVRHGKNPVADTDYRLVLKPGTFEIERVEGEQFPGKIGAHTVIREDGKFRMWYDSQRLVPGKRGRDKPQFVHHLAYAESDDGLNWRFPSLGIAEFNGSKDNNLLVPWEARTPHLLRNIPENDRRGYRYIFQCRSNKPRPGIYLVGSHDGVHWDWDKAMLIAKVNSDTYNNILYDERRQEYVMYLRAKDRYLAGQDDIARDDPVNGGESRRIARIASKELWTDWMEKGTIQNILLPDALDYADGYTRLYLMPTVRYAGIYWGYLGRLRQDLTAMDTQLATSRDGRDFQRLPDRPKLLEVGPEGAWDHGMVLVYPGWVEVGDEWWIYYRGDDRDHRDSPRNSAVGLLKLRKEGFVSMRGPSGGGVVVTRQIRWPGGGLLVNADAHAGELKVRISGERRQPLPGFDYADCATFTGDSIAHKIAWKDQSLDALKGEVIRLEFMIKNADLYSFRASGGTP
jgi:hypothetical protein